MSLFSVSTVSFKTLFYQSKNSLFYATLPNVLLVCCVCGLSSMVCKKNSARKIEVGTG